MCHHARGAPLLRVAPGVAVALTRRSLPASKHHSGFSPPLREEPRKPEVSPHTSLRFGDNMFVAHFLRMTRRECQTLIGPSERGYAWTSDDC